MIDMFYRKTRDVIVETATLVKGIITTQDKMQQDIGVHIEDDKAHFEEMGKIIKECTEQCPESKRFNEYMAISSDTLKRIEDKNDVCHKATSESRRHSDKRQDDYIRKLDALTTEKKTVRQIALDVVKVVTLLVAIGGLVFGIIKYNEHHQAEDDKKIEGLLNAILDHKDGN